MGTARMHSGKNLARMLGGIAALLLGLTLASSVRGAPICLEAMPGQVWEDTFPLWVNVYTGTNFSGTCRSIPMGLLIPDLKDPSWGLDRAIRSVKIGRRVRLRVFWYANFANKWNWWETSQQSLGTWNANASSLRVEDRSIRADCSNLPFNTVALYEHSDF